MEASRGETPQFEAPTTVNVGGGGEKSLPRGEVRPSSLESSPAKGPAAPIISQPLQGIQPALPLNDPLTDDSTKTGSNLPIVTPANDTDRIERQWIDKAKYIVQQTKDDPYKQKDEMSRVKAEYIQQRFKKTLKTDNTLAT